MFALLLISAAGITQGWIQPSVQTKTAIKAAVGDQLRDGKSALYRWPKEDRGGVLYCGFVNGKNAFGAYAGYQPFLIMGAHADGRRGDGSYQVMRVILSSDGDAGSSEIVTKMCTDKGYDVTNLPPEAN